MTKTNNNEYQKKRYEERKKEKMTKTEKENQLKAKKEHEMTKIITQKAAQIFIEAALEITEDNYEEAKQLLAIKKAKTLEIEQDTRLKVISLNLAIESLDNEIIKQHGEIKSIPKIR